MKNENITDEDNKLRLEINHDFKVTEVTEV